MKKITKISVSLLLVLSLMFSLAAPVFATEKKCDCGEEPVIYVAALGSATLYDKAGTEDEEVVFRPETEAYLKLVGSLLLPIGRLIIDGNYDAFGTSLAAAVNGVFGKLANAENGDSTPNITTKEELTAELRNYNAGDTATITVHRSGKNEVLTVTFDEKTLEQIKNKTAASVTMRRSFYVY